jgi:hypothetical protein
MLPWSIEQMIQKGSFYVELECVLYQFLKYCMNILLGDFSATINTAVIIRPMVENKRLHEISIDNGVRVVNFATLKNLIIRKAIFPQCNIHKFTWTSPNGKTRRHIDHILIDRRRHSSVFNI